MSRDEGRAGGKIPTREGDAVVLDGVVVCVVFIGPHATSALAVAAPAGRAKETPVTATAAPDVRRPRTDERRLWEIMFGVFGGQAFLVALDLNLFTLLGERPRSVAEVASALRLAERAAETLLILCTSLGLLERRGERFALTPLAEDYLVPGRPAYFGDFLRGAMIQPGRHQPGDV